MIDEWGWVRFAIGFMSVLGAGLGSFALVAGVVVLLVRVGDRIFLGIDRWANRPKGGGWTANAKALTVCRHPDAIEVRTDNDLDQGTLVAWWCAACETQLPATWKRELRGGKPLGKSKRDFEAAARGYHPHDAAYDIPPECL